MQVMGASYYTLYIFNLLDCKMRVLENQANSATLGWDEITRECAMEYQIEQGIFSDIYKNKIGSRAFVQRYMYCFSWGLKCLRYLDVAIYYGSNDFLDNVFAIILFFLSSFICIFALFELDYIPNMFLNCLYYPSLFMYLFFVYLLKHLAAFCNCNGTMECRYRHINLI